MTMDKTEIIPALNKNVIYDGKTYTLCAYILRKTAKCELYHVAELQDMHGNSLMYVPLELVNIKKG